MATRKNRNSRKSRKSRTFRKGGLFNPLTPWGRCMNRKLAESRNGVLGKDARALCDQEAAGRFF